MVVVVVARSRNIHIYIGPGELLPPRPPANTDRCTCPFLLGGAQQKYAYPCLRGGPGWQQPGVYVYVSAPEVMVVSDSGGATFIRPFLLLLRVCGVAQLTSARVIACPLPLVAGNPRSTRWSHPSAWRPWNPWPRSGAPGLQSKALQSKADKKVLQGTARQNGTERRSDPPEGAKPRARTCTATNCGKRGTKNRTACRRGVHSTRIQHKIPHV